MWTVAVRIAAARAAGGVKVVSPRRAATGSAVAARCVVLVDAAVMRFSFVRPGRDGPWSCRGWCYRLASL
ncbi:hypothetical protein Kpho02_26620 [Kitasatospora phosalacinea]|uniref:Uncharacterized protein n=1 Tax=Kitasatospora phosalacinea TaxID=2065 RepID=A0A9W6Q8C5_9ACTN|nr:hypothetical protein Kpho02_26620 [Kitasatospora phosalacinea]